MCARSRQAAYHRSIMNGPNVGIAETIVEKTFKVRFPLRIPEVLIGQAIFRYRSSVSLLASERFGEASRPLPARMSSWAFPIASKKTTHTQTPKITMAGSATIQEIKFNKIPNSILSIRKISPPSRVSGRIPLHLGVCRVAIDARFSKNGVCKILYFRRQIGGIELRGANPKVSFKFTLIQQQECPFETGTSLAITI